MHEVKQYIAWCKEKGHKPSNPAALKIYVQKIKNTNSRVLE